MMIRNFIRRFFTPTRMTVTSFALVILLGTLFLSLPVVTTDGSRIALIDAFFVASSAVCVTGLSPIDISTKFNFLGQFILLILMQIGGLGLMTFTTSLYFFFGQRLPITERLSIQETFQSNPGSQIRKLIKYILLFTFSIEAIGAILLFIYWTATEQFPSASQTLWFSIFHAVSAFTHGSFSLFSNSLMGFQKDFFVQAVITTLILCGGLGFLIVFELKGWLTWFFSKKDKAARFRLSVQTRLTLITTLSVILLGTALIFISERNGVFGGMSTAEAIMNSYFFSIVPRTSGFNTVEMSGFGGTAILIIMILMFIGGSSGSTAGGIKLGTFGLLVAYTIARLKGDAQLNLWNRTIPQSSIDKASAVVVASAGVILFSTLLVMFSETYGLAGKESAAKFVPILFEVISAFGTVGLSLDLTPQLSDAGKFILALTMFTGRVGAISLAMAISLREKKTEFSYAEENIMIG